MEHHMKILGPTTGDEHVTWDPEDQKSVQKAEERFKDLVVAGQHKAYRVTQTPTRTGEPLREFDPSLKEIILVPAMQGG